MMDLVRKLEGLSKQLDLEGRADQARPYIPLRRADSQVLRTAAAVICKQAAEIASLKESLAAHKKEM